MASLDRRENVLVQLSGIPDIFAKEQGKHWETVRREVEDLGYKLIAVVHDLTGADEYASEAFKGDVYLDSSQAIYSALGGGVTRVQYLLEERFIMGGVLVIKDGESKYFWCEDLFGGFAPIDLEIMPMLRHLAGHKCS